MKQFASFQLDTANACVLRNGERIELAPRPFAVLRYLVENPGRLITHDELLDALWPDTFVQPQVLRTYMLELRKMLGDDADNPRFIQTLPKRGYRFVPAVTEGKCVSPLPPGAGAVHLSATLHGESSVMVGRDEELAQLISQGQRMAEGQRRIVFITGEAGIGKSSLVDAFCRYPAGEALCIGRGQCVEGFGGKEEYYPVMEALRQLCASPQSEELCGILARVAPGWLVRSGREYESASPEIQGMRPILRERMLGEICDALEELAARKPVLLLFEDLHWADASTLNLISALARRRAPAKLMVLATLRPQSVEAGHPLKSLKQDLLMRRLCSETALRPLAKTAVREFLVRELKQETPPQGLSSFVHQHAEGNPLFMIAILEYLLAQRLLVEEQTADGRMWKLRLPFEQIELGVPSGLEQMIELEMERLSPDEQRLLEAGSLAGMIFPIWAAAAALGADPADLEEAYEQLARRIHFLQRAGEDELPDGTRAAFYVFAHNLYREALCRRQPAAQRSRRHRRIAMRLEELFAGREWSVARELATHYEAAGDWPRAANAWRTAAEHARGRQACDECLELLEHALQLTENMSPAERSAVESVIRKDLERMTEHCA
jgi:predicted ATPase/DNA-binding winged helix-turn-helix (wHTH) protein